MKPSCAYGLAGDPRRSERTRLRGNYKQERPKNLAPVRSYLVRGFFSQSKRFGARRVPTPPSGSTAILRSRRALSTASILVALLWCLTILTVVVIGTLHAAHLDLRIGKNHGDVIQAHYLAVAGVETAKALLYHDAMVRRNTGVNHTGNLYDAPDQFRDVVLGRGRFRVLRPGQPDEYEGTIFGVSDEESRLNVNTASAEVLVNLDGVDQELAMMLLAYRDQLNPFRTFHELLLVEGVTPFLLFGDAGIGGTGRGGVRSAVEEGLSAALTIHSSVRNVNARGEERIDVQNADENELLTISGITSEIAQAIISYRGQNRFQSIADLLDVRAGDGAGEDGQSTSQNNSGPELIDEELLMRIADDIKVDGEEAGTGLININTASASVLAYFPEIDHDLAYAIVSHRASNGYFANPVELLRVPDMNRDVLKSVLPQVTARSETFRIVSEGKTDATGASRRIQTVVRVGSSGVETLFYKEEI